VPRVALAGGIALFLAIATVRLSLLDRWDVSTAARLVVAALAGGLAATGRRWHRRCWRSSWPCSWSAW